MLMGNLRGETPFLRCCMSCLCFRCDAAKRVPWTNFCCSQFVLFATMLDMPAHLSQGCLISLSRNYVLGPEIHFDARLFHPACWQWLCISTSTGKVSCLENHTPHTHVPCPCPGPTCCFHGKRRWPPRLQSRALARCLGNIRSGEVFIFVVPARLEIVFAARQTAVVIVSFAVYSCIIAKGGSRHEHLLAWHTDSRTFERASHNPLNVDRYVLCVCLRLSGLSFAGCSLVVIMVFTHNE
jgi:hypothetical protein